MFEDTLSLKLPNLHTFDRVSVKNVFDVYVRKVCNTRLQEFLSAMKQDLATKKGLASTVDLNLRTTLLTYHTKLEAKLRSDSL